MTTDAQLLREEEAARLLGCRPRTLKSWRAQGLGPPFVRISRRFVRYRPSDLLHWVACHVQPQKNGGGARC